MEKKLLLIAVALSGLVLLGLGGVTAVQLQKSQQTNTIITSTQDTELELVSSFVFPIAKPLAPFSLTDQYGNAFTNSQLNDKWSLFFIGYTSCPDVCPTTMGKLTAAYPKLLENADLQVIFLSVDPQRDTQAKLLSYMNFFNPEFIAITGEHAQLFPLTRELGFVYAMIGEEEDYLVNHSASMALISPDGNKVAIIKPKSSVPGKLPLISNKNLIADIQTIIANYKADPSS
ncbi:SCO1/SenC family protein [Shewanella benthica]|uniref:SCO1/SenC family protein n=1 Tax=Shewanella benthica TaxID=43661 RepID=A0A330LZD1_9GAMM|nr:SCO family protein [Shewanella benthica]SQH74734.1 SCO1/SenC family protein [Shewanella benthica]